MKLPMLAADVLVLAVDIRMLGDLQFKLFVSKIFSYEKNPRDKGSPH